MDIISKLYTRKCPMCGAINRDLLLEETGGWMECEKCKAATCLMEDMKTNKIPLFTAASFSKVT